MDLDPDKYEAVLLIEEARFANLPVTAYVELSPYWRAWHRIAHQAQQKAAKIRQQES